MSDTILEHRVEQLEQRLDAVDGGPRRATLAPEAPDERQARALERIAANVEQERAGNDVLRELVLAAVVAYVLYRVGLVVGRALAEYYAAPGGGLSQ